MGRHLRPTLATPLALLRKLEREQYRAFHERHPMHKADHFYNFCVTAHAMRDFVLEHLGYAGRSARAPFQRAWSSQPLLAAVGDVANASKHFTLRFPNGMPRPVNTRGVSRRRGKVAAIYVSRDGSLVTRIEDVPEIVVHLSDGTRHELWQFMDSVVRFWRNDLKRIGLRPRQQPFGVLSGA